jgi:hypothetical protein
MIIILITKFLDFPNSGTSGIDKGFTCMEAKPIIVTTRKKRWIFQRQIPISYTGLEPVIPVVVGLHISRKALHFQGIHSRLALRTHVVTR